MFKYDVIRLGGGLDQNDDNDDSFGGWGVWDLNDDMISILIVTLLARTNLSIIAGFSLSLRWAV